MDKEFLGAVAEEEANGTFDCGQAFFRIQVRKVDLGEKVV
jgi:hypothetical protein